MPIKCAIALAVLALLLGKDARAADIWRCPGNVFTSKASATADCAPFKGSRVCGAGLNRYYTPERAGLSDAEKDCDGDHPEASPLAGSASHLNNGTKPSNWSRKLESTLAQETSKDTISKDIKRELGEIRELLPKIPGGEAILDLLHSE